MYIFDPPSFHHHKWAITSWNTLVAVLALGLTSQTSQGPAALHTVVCVKAHHTAHHPVASWAKSPLVLIQLPPRPLASPLSLRELSLLLFSFLHWHSWNTLPPSQLSLFTLQVPAEMLLPYRGVPWPPVIPISEGPVLTSFTLLPLHNFFSTCVIIC